MKLLLATAALLCVGCTHVDGGPPSPGTDACNAARAQQLVGQTVSAALSERAMRLSGARVTRTLHPGQIITMEYRADRLNIRVDGRGKVLAITCG